MWKQATQTYWWPTPFRSVAKAGLVLKAIDSVSGPGPDLRNALWHGKDTPGQVKILWEDEGAQGWEDFTAYRWRLQHRPHTGFIQVQIFSGDREIINSGTVLKELNLKIIDTKNLLFILQIFFANMSRSLHYKSNLRYTNKDKENLHNISQYLN
jgi:hypothetical protein